MVKEMDAPAQSTVQISLTINGERREFDVEPNTTLLEILREKLKMTRTKEGCSVGECGSCTVIMNKKAVNSCLILAVDADGADVVTVEGMATDTEFHPMQEAFVDHVAIQTRLTGAGISERQQFLTFCHICCGHCAVKVTVADGMIVDMAPDTEGGFPSEMCVVRKGRLSIPEIHTHPDRLKYPMKRVGERGEGKWERISWDEALDTIASKFKDIRENYGPEYLVVGLGEPKGLEFAFGERFATAFGTPNVLTPGWICGVNFGLANNFTFGGVTVPDDDQRPKLMVMWGVNSNHTTGGLRRETISTALEEGAKMIVIDPRKIDLASVADLWIKPRPGSDGALALGVLKVVIEEKLYDKDVVANMTVGFDKLEEEMRTFSLEDVEKVTWVPQAQIREFARMVGETGPACMQWGNSLDQAANSFQLHRVLSILIAITGNLNVPGGMVILNSERNFIRSGRFFLLNKIRRNAEKSLANEYPLALRSAFVPARVALKAIMEEKPYLPKAGIFILTNPILSYPDAKKAYDALMKLEFTVVTELFMTPTAAIADIVLPAAAGMEHDEVGYWPGWYGEVRAHPKLVDPPGECWPDTKIINELAKRIGIGEHFWEDDGEAIEVWLEPSGLSFDELKRKRTLLPQRQYGTNVCKTPSGKVEVYCKVLEELKLDPLPTWNVLGTIPDANEDFPFLLTNAKEEVYVNTGYKQVPSLRAMRPEPVVTMHPDAAQKAGVKEGEEVYIETKAGKIKQRLVLDRNLDPRVVNAAFGWWFPEDAKSVYGWDRSNINVLIGDEGPYDTAVGCQVLRGVPCRVYKV
ncbi:MAG: molybdopterin-dependent oxidoreductase [Chloroflexi bacterium]|nr:molybdopterin-dependent oxidoreductase [Chloroflexota bacterium]